MAVDIIARAMAANAQGGGEGGTSDYNQLSNQPKINGVTLRGNKTTADLHLEYDDSEVKQQLETLFDASDEHDRDIQNLQNDLDHKQGTLTAGANITISKDNVISATGGGTGTIQVYSGKTEPEDMNILIWIDTSDEEPVGKDNFITKDGKIFMTSANEEFIVKGEDE